MKQDSIQQMLERYRTGTLDENELAELNRLTHRDEVMSAAERRASGILRRRRTVAFTVAGLLVAAAAVWTLLPLGANEEPMLVAEASVPETVITTTESNIEQAASTTPAALGSTTLGEEPDGARQPERQSLSNTVTKAGKMAEIRRSVLQSHDEDPVVVCNNQCEADSVINDIWKFLTV